MTQVLRGSLSQYTLKGLSPKKYLDLEFFIAMYSIAMSFTEHVSNKDISPQWKLNLTLLMDAYFICIAIGAH